ncbi:hypothetical protein CYPRO_2620 [Cyclonatronum proteinivorum]|uniref:Uncharacterized protein n=1 Tax=Cyclonatronum proteinivorum TaxID=1457365 RepID=A0A345UN10_9BACT|nr:hypothetical protein [Cyclonatronum proteinivorum]AXJ01862.1 hypothetical protein CYPRO_2620 [Cyclonatronum proteinivorum]
MSKTGRQIEKLFHQQCWCWGADIRNGNPNYLLQYGFTKSPRPCPDCGSSRYTLLRDGLQIHLWAFGALWQSGNKTALCLKRYDRQPSLFTGEISPDCIHEVSEFEGHMQRIPRSSLPLYHAEFAEFISFMVSYEAFIRQHAPAGYRNRCLKGWPHKCMEGSRMEAAWRDLRAHLTNGKPGPAAA